MKNKYNNIVKAIYKEAKNSEIDVRDLIRVWTMFYEKSRVVGFDRELFLDACVEQEKKK